MTVKQTFNEPPRVKIVTNIGNVPLADSEEGELYFDAATNKLNLRTSAGYILFSKDA